MPPFDEANVWVPTDHLTNLGLLDSMLEFKFFDDLLKPYYSRDLHADLVCLKEVYLNA
jgi:hypothetical protein